MDEEQKPQTLLGFPVVYSDKVPPLGNRVDVVLVDPGDMLQLYHCSCRKCRREFWLNKRQLETFACPSCAAERN